jgi:AcrR family transcriptional regulator
VAREGLAAVSVRTVATEAGVSPTALRHYFSTQDVLLEYAMQAVVDQVAERIRPMLAMPMSDVDATGLLEALLPLDETRRSEQRTYLAFVTRADTQPVLHAVRDQADARLREVVRHVVDVLAAQCQLGAGRDRARETDRLFALVDGLAFQGTLSAQRHPPDQLTAILRAHLAELARPGTSPT